MLLASCATVPVSGPAPRHQVPIVFLEGQPNRPFVELRVGHSVGWFLLDTGAAGHVMSDWFYAAAFPGQALHGRRAVAVDFAGVAIPMTLVGAVPTQWADGQQRLLEFSVGPFSLPGDVDGLAGVISPQLLAQVGSLELDFRGGALRWWEHRPTRGVSYSLADRTLRACPGGSHGEVIYAWAMGVEGEPMWAMMDTGAPMTAVSPGSDVGRRLTPTSEPMKGGRGASNAPVLGRVTSATMQFGGVAWVGRVALIHLPLEQCGAMALLGMNLLRQCSVVLSGDSGTVLCSPTR